MRSQPRQVIAARFELGAVAGSGGMGTVYRATDRLDGRQVAVKVLDHHSPAAADRFVRESRILAELEDPRIVSYVAHGVTDEGEPYLAMEWLDGEDLARRLARSPLDAAEALALCERVAGGLAAAHARHIVHRDIKPSNIFLVDGRIDRIRILDFGIARLGESDQPLTRTGMVLGTPGYMSPEQVRGERELDSRTDVFALGCVLYECLAGRPAFGGGSAMAILAKILLEEAPRLVASLPEVAGELDDLVTAMLAKDRARRPAGAAAVAAALAAIGARGVAAEDRPARAAAAGAGGLTGRERRLLALLAFRAPDPAGPVEVPTAAGSREVAFGPGESLLDVASAAVESYGGRLERLLDGTLVAVVAGAGLAATDLAVRAARLALALRAVGVPAPLAIATGRSAEPQVGEVIDRLATLLLAPAPEAARAQLDDVTAGLLAARFEITDAAGGAAGFLLAERVDDSPARTFLGRPTLFVGREREMHALESLVAECAAERAPRTAVVSGPPGIGKSRLRHQLVERLRARPDRPDVWTARGDPTAAGSPFGMLRQLIRCAAGIGDGEPLAVRQRKLAVRVAPHFRGRDLVRVVEFIGELGQIPFPAAEQGPLALARQDAALMGDQMRRAWIDWLDAESRVRPLVIVLEDLHWGDQPTVSFVEAALRSLEERPILLVAIGRGEMHDQFPRLGKGRGVVEIRLDELPRRACERLVEQVLGPGAPATARLVELAGGNAFYLEELIRSASSGAEPAAVHAMIQARLEALPPEARRLLRAAAVFGHTFWRGGLEALIADTSVELDRWLALLEDQELVTRWGERRFPGEEEHRFRHGLVRDTAYLMLTDEDRALGHRMAASWLEAAGESQAIVLAEHLERGGDPRRAADWYRRAGEQALEGNDYTSALTHAAAAARCGVEGEELGLVRLLQAEAALWGGDNPSASSWSREAMGLLPARGRAWYEAVAGRAVAIGRLGQEEELVALTREALLPEPPADAALPFVRGAGFAALDLLGFGERELADALLAACERVAAADDSPLVAAHVARRRAALAGIAGDPASIIRFSAIAAEKFEAAGDWRSAGTDRVNIGWGCYVMGALEEAEEVLRHGLAMGERLGVIGTVANARSNLCAVLMPLGRLAEAREAGESAVVLCRAIGEVRTEAATRVYLARVHLAADDSAAAEREVAAIFELVGVPPWLQLYARAIRVAARTATARIAEGLAEGEGLTSDAGRLAEMEEGEAFVRLAEAELLVAAGRTGEARDALARARQHVVTTAERIGEPAWRAGFLARVPENARILALADAWGV